MTKTRSIGPSRPAAVTLPTEANNMPKPTQVTLPTGPSTYVDKATLAESGAQFVVTAIADGSYNGKPQYDITIVDSEGDEGIVTLGAGGSRDAAVRLIRAELVKGSEAVGPFVLRTFETSFGKPGYALANA